MILLVEMDTRGWRPLLRPFRFRGPWRGRRTWRVGWLWWSLSYYPEPAIRPFFDWVENTSWREEIDGADRYIARQKALADLERDQIELQSEVGE